MDKLDQAIEIVEVAVDDQTKLMVALSCMGLGFSEDIAKAKQDALVGVLNQIKELSETPE